MSNLSYHQRVREKITGPSHPNCYIAAFDRIAEIEVSRQSYLAYLGFIAIENTPEPNGLSLSDIERVYSYALDCLALDFGLDSHYDFRFERAENIRGLKKIVRQALRKGDLVVVNVEVPNFEASAPNQPATAEAAHAMGLVGLSPGYETFLGRSTWLPPDLRGMLDYEDLYGHLQINTPPRRANFPASDANITIIPNC